jgi:hypothetical protein
MGLYLKLVTARLITAGAPPPLTCRCLAPGCGESIREKSYYQLTLGDGSVAFLHIGQCTVHIVQGHPTFGHARNWCPGLPEELQPPPPDVQIH